MIILVDEEEKTVLMSDFSLDVKADGGIAPLSMLEGGAVAVRCVTSTFHAYIIPRYARSAVGGQCW